MFRAISKSLGIPAEVERKACELERLVQLKCPPSTQFNSQTYQAVILWLAANKTCYSISQSDLLRVTGVSSDQFKRCTKLLQHTLGLQKSQSLRQLADMCNCPQAVDLGAKLLQKYTENQTRLLGDSVDFSRPEFLCASLAAAAKKLKLKGAIKSLEQRSQIKKTLFHKLVNTMSALHAQVEAERENQCSNDSDKQADLTSTEDHARPAKRQKVDDSDDEQAQTTEDDFQAWQKRILES